MAQPLIVEITPSGTIVLPEEIRKYISPGTKFTVFQRGDTISLKKVEEQGIPRTPEFVASHQALCDKLSKWAKEQGITEHDIKETCRICASCRHLYRFRLAIPLTTTPLP
jgi:bifunctional DNA-binding transcriptional regulator/antitoxin component of YhaV-PrlF toxin-antitoxin module